MKRDDLTFKLTERGLGVETPEQYARRTLYDLANILDNLDKENWERDQKIIVKALQTHSSVLRRIAERIGPFS